MLKLASALLLCSAAMAWGLSPKPETNRAFDQYVSQAEHEMRTRAFLYADTHAEARTQARQGKIFVAEQRNSSVRVPEGAIHDWLGVAFFPGASIARVRATLENYPEYKRIYAPDVSDSHQLARTGDRFHISLRLENKQFVTLHYDSEYDVDYRAPTEGKLEVQSHSTRIAQQGEDYGFLWRLDSTWRFEEADGGVYAECRSISLSRAIPFGFGWMRGALEKFPRDSMVHTIEATRRAVAHP
jgi:hypothetical protein